MVGWLFPLHFPFLSGGLGKLKSLTSPENVAAPCNWLSPLEVTREPVGFSGVDSDGTRVAYEAVGSWLQRLVTQPLRRRRRLVSGKSQRLCLPSLYPAPFILRVDSGHWGQLRSGGAGVSRHSTKTTHFKICPLI